MQLQLRKADNKDVEQLRSLALQSWSQFEQQLAPEHWQKLSNTLNDAQTYTDLLNTSYGIVCEYTNNDIVGMAFLVPHCNPTDIYPADLCYIRFLTVAPAFSGNGIGLQLTEKCIELAKAMDEHTIALHTSEMMHPAQRIYERLGFKIVRELEPRLGKRYWLFKLDIGI